MFIGLWIYQNQPVKKISLLGIIADMKEYKANKTKSLTGKGPKISTCILTLKNNFGTNGLLVLQMWKMSVARIKDDVWMNHSMINDYLLSCFILFLILLNFFNKIAFFIK